MLERIEHTKSLHKIMSLCINPVCSKPDDNADIDLFCRACGSGLLLRDRYRVMGKLGKGGFGITYEVTKKGSTVPEVLKLLTSDNLKVIELFQQEAQVLGSLDDPGIPKVEKDSYFVHKPKNSSVQLHCFVMEKIVGIDMQNYIDQKGGCNLPDQKIAIEWLEELVLVLDKVHSHNFFHRDIKPSNIMMRSDGKLVLIDFGTARKVTTTVVEQQGKVTQVISLGYTPQEQSEGYAIPQSDFFALGRTFVALLTGKQPIDLYDSLHDEVRWRNHASSISPMFADLIDNMMSRKPIARPSNTKSILQKLKEIKQELNSPSTKKTPPLLLQEKQKIDYSFVIEAIVQQVPITLLGTFVFAPPVFWATLVFREWNSSFVSWPCAGIIIGSRKFTCVFINFSSC
jgi:serine/threonine protein kinase